MIGAVVVELTRRIDDVLSQLLLSTAPSLCLSLVLAKAQSTLTAREMNVRLIQKLDHNRLMSESAEDTFSGISSALASDLCPDAAFIATSEGSEGGRMECRSLAGVFARDANVRSCVTRLLRDISEAPLLAAGSARSKPGMRRWLMEDNSRFVTMTMTLTKESGTAAGQTGDSVAVVGLVRRMSKACRNGDKGSRRTASGSERADSVVRALLARLTPSQSHSSKQTTRAADHSTNPEHELETAFSHEQQLVFQRLHKPLVTLLSEATTRDHLVAALKRSVDGRVLKRLVGQEAPLAPKRADITVLFCYLNAEELAESLKAEEFIEFCNEYFETHTSLINKGHGLIDKV